jgi:iron complex outermembrane receptor protein
MAIGSFSTSKALLICSTAVASYGLGAPADASAQPPARTQATILVQVVDTTQAPVPRARIRLIELHRSGLTDESGAMGFTQVPTGEYIVLAEAIGFQPYEKDVRVSDHDTVRVRIELTRLLLKLAPLVVTGTIGERRGTDVLSPVSVVTGEEMDRTVKETVAASLRDQPGVALQTLGPSTGRPVIRGLGGDRILILEDGLRPGDMSSTSADHAVAVEAITAEQFEVVRGPMSLLYGSSALGGVVNVIREEVPTSLPERLHGTLKLQGSAVTRGITGGGYMTGSVGKAAWRLEGSARDAGDVHTPVGVLVNTGATTYNLAAGVGIERAGGHIGASYRFYDNAYGIPGGFVGGHDTGVDITMRRHTARMETDFHDVCCAHSTLRITGQFTDYGHDEREPSGAVGTWFDQKLAASEAVFRHGPVGPFALGAVGVRGQYRDIRTGGTLHTPSTYDIGAAVFAVEELALGSWHLQAGARHDWAHYVPRDTTAFISAGGERLPVRPRTFGSVSGSLGLIYAFGDAVRIGFSASRAFRTPDFNELYSNGPHLAANSYDVGDPTLSSETGIGLDAFVRLSTQRVRGEVAAFRNEMRDYIFPSSRGRAELGAQGGRPRFQYTNEDALFVGLEADFQWNVVSSFVLEGTTSLVRAHFTSELDSIPVFSGTDTTFVPASPYPPFIPPIHGRIGLRFDRQAAFVGVAARFAARQDRLGDFESPTAGYVVADVTAGVRFLLGGYFHAVTFTADNLFDTEYRDHLARVKEIMPEPGRNLSLLYRLEF